MKNILFIIHLFYIDITKENEFKNVPNILPMKNRNINRKISFQKLASTIGYTSAETIAKYTDILELLRLIYIVPNSDNPLKALN